MSDPLPRGNGLFDIIDNLAGAAVNIGRGYNISHDNSAYIQQLGYDGKDFIDNGIQQAKTSDPIQLSQTTAQLASQWQTRINSDTRLSDDEKIAAMNQIRPILSDYHNKFQGAVNAAADAQETNTHNSNALRGALLANDESVIDKSFDDAEATGAYTIQAPKIISPLAYDASPEDIANAQDTPGWGDQKVTLQYGKSAEEWSAMKEIVHNQFRLEKFKQAFSNSPDDTLRNIDRFGMNKDTTELTKKVYEQKFQKIQTDNGVKILSAVRDQNSSLDSLLNITPEQIASDPASMKQLADLTSTSRSIFDQSTALRNGNLVTDQALSPTDTLMTRLESLNRDVQKIVTKPAPGPTTSEADAAERENAVKNYLDSNLDKALNGSSLGSPEGGKATQGLLDTLLLDPRFKGHEDTAVGTFKDAIKSRIDAINKAGTEMNRATAVTQIGDVRSQYVNLNRLGVPSLANPNGKGVLKSLLDTATARADWVDKNWQAFGLDNALVSESRSSQLQVSELLRQVNEYRPGNDPGRISADTQTLGNLKSMITDQITQNPNMTQEQIRKSGANLLTLAGPDFTKSGDFNAWVSTTAQDYQSPNYKALIEVKKSLSGVNTGAANLATSPQWDSLVQQAFDETWQWAKSQGIKDGSLSPVKLNSDTLTQMFTINTLNKLKAKGYKTDNVTHDQSLDLLTPIAGKVELKKNGPGETLANWVSFGLAGNPLNDDKILSLVSSVPLQGTGADKKLQELATAVGSELGQKGALVSYDPAGFAYIAIGGKHLWPVPSGSDPKNVDAQVTAKLKDFAPGIEWSSIGHGGPNQ